MVIVVCVDFFDESVSCFAIFLCRISPFPSLRQHGGMQLPHISPKEFLQTDDLESCIGGRGRSINWCIRWCVRNWIAYIILLSCACARSCCRHSGRTVSFRIIGRCVGITRWCWTRGRNCWTTRSKNAKMRWYQFGVQRWLNFQFCNDKIEYELDVVQLT